MVCSPSHALLPHGVSRMARIFGCPTPHSSACSWPGLGTTGGLRSWSPLLPAMPRWGALGPEGLWGPYLSALHPVFHLLPSQTPRTAAFVHSSSSTNLVPKRAIPVVTPPFPLLRENSHLYHCGVHRAPQDQEEKPQWLRLRKTGSCAQQSALGHYFTPPILSLCICKIEPIILTPPICCEN